MAVPHTARPVEATRGVSKSVRSDRRAWTMPTSFSAAAGAVHALLGEKRCGQIHPGRSFLAASCSPKPAVLCRFFGKSGRVFQARVNAHARGTSTWPFKSSHATSRSLPWPRNMLMPYQTWLRRDPGAIAGKSWRRVDRRGFTHAGEWTISLPRQRGRAAFQLPLRQKARDYARAVRRRPAILLLDEDRPRP